MTVFLILVALPAETRAPDYSSRLLAVADEVIE
jgi:hypothetical protein